MMYTEVSLPWMVVVSLDSFFFLKGIYYMHCILWI